MRNNFLIPIFIFFLTLLSSSAPFGTSKRAAPQEAQVAPEKKATLLRLLDLIPSSESIDFVQEKTQYQLHTLVTEQRHPKTMNLDERISQDMEAGLQLLLTVDEDICVRLLSLDRSNRVLERAVQAIEKAILSEKKIYIFGCQETGRWTKWVESSLWRPFWRKLQTREKIWAKVKSKVGDFIESRLVGEMPGADRALISPLEGWGDLMITGRLQLEERGIEPGDVVFCVSASGESPAAIGTVFEALDRWTKRYPYEAEKIQKTLFFFHNNPEESLLSFDRCKVVLGEPGISKINCTTGPQAIAGASRMQASTVDVFLVAQILQTAIDRTLRRYLSDKEMTKLGFTQPVVFADKMGEFSEILREVKKIVPAIAKMTMMAEETRQNGGFATYMALRGLGTVFNDCAERGPAFQLWPLDTVKTDPRKSRIQVWAPRLNLEEAWTAILGRPFRGLSSQTYKKRIEQDIKNPALLQKIWENLKNAEDDQQFLYDFSFSDFNLRNRGAKKGDLGILVVISPEDTLLKNNDSFYSRFVSHFQKEGAGTAILFITEKSEKEVGKLIQKVPGFDPEGKDTVAVLTLDFQNDPLAINRLIALKIIMNAHSTAVMARSGRVIGNTVMAVNPDNPKSIGRATALILSHVNDVFKMPDWVKRHGIQNPISYGEANAVLYDAIGFLEGKRGGLDQSIEIALSIIRILESLRLNKAISIEEALTFVRNKGLRQYLKDVTS